MNPPPGSHRLLPRLVDAALEEVNFFDTAQSYGGGSSERWLGMALAGVRKSVDCRCWWSAGSGSSP
jgi:aryl-alcohol dehydrogenase-like predicted oxidoreductase